MDNDKKNIIDLTGKAALITGGGRGLGRGMAVALAEAGADVAIADINMDNARAVSDEITALGLSSIYIKVDVTKKDQVKQMVSKTVEKFGRLDIAVNSAGVPGSRLPSAEDIEESDVRKFIDIMLLGSFFCSQEQGKQMIKQKKGRIINISSVSGSIVNKGLVGLAPYCAAKAGVIHMSRALASDWAKYNITVNTISPGFMRTPATESVLAIPERYKTYIDTVPLNRIGIPEDLAGAVVFLASDSSSYITGHDLLVDGGITIW